MKKNIWYSVVIVVLSLIFSINVKAMDSPTLADNPARELEKEKIESAEAKTILARLEVIKAMDKSEMSAKEKRQLRKEVRALRSQMAQIGGGIYISAGALIIILLLILLL